ncbi:hypothetical protein FB451DRAFT_1165073 [Mycena latifolia]|nr:hypothetical protein FB451DRAFT_1165073 [Mycena latifolia]
MPIVLLACLASTHELCVDAQTRPARGEEGWRRCVCVHAITNASLLPRDGVGSPIFDYMTPLTGRPPLCSLGEYMYGLRGDHPPALICFSTSHPWTYAFKSKPREQDRFRAHRGHLDCVNGSYVARRAIPPPQCRRADACSFVLTSSRLSFAWLRIPASTAAQPDHGGFVQSICSGLTTPRVKPEALQNINNATTASAPFGQWAMLPTPAVDLCCAKITSQYITGKGTPESDIWSAIKKGRRSLAGGKVCGGGVVAQPWAPTGIIT